MKILHTNMFINKYNLVQRVISGKPWKDCALWIKSKFDLYTEHVKIQKATITTYDGKNHTLQNIIASFLLKS